MGDVRSLLSAILYCQYMTYYLEAGALALKQHFIQKFRTRSRLQYTVSFTYPKIPEKKVYWEAINLPNVFKQCVQTEIRLKEEVFDPKFYR